LPKYTGFAENARRARRCGPTVLPAASRVVRGRISRMCWRTQAAVRHARPCALTSRMRRADGARALKRRKLRTRDLACVFRRDAFTAEKKKGGRERRTIVDFNYPDLRSSACSPGQVSGLAPASLRIKATGTRRENLRTRFSCLFALSVGVMWREERGRRRGRRGEIGRYGPEAAKLFFFLQRYGLFRKVYAIASPFNLQVRERDCTLIFHSTPIH
jgi:hypothetical protein